MDRLEKLPCRSDDRPKSDVIVTDCGMDYGSASSLGAAEGSAEVVVAHAGLPTAFGAVKTSIPPPKSVVAAPFVRQPPVAAPTSTVAATETDDAPSPELSESDIAQMNPRQRKLFELKMKMNEARRINSREVQDEKKRINADDSESRKKDKERDDDDKKDKERDEGRASGMDPKLAAQLNQTAEKHLKEVSKKRKTDDGSNRTNSLAHIRAITAICFMLFTITHCFILPFSPFFFCATEFDPRTRDHHLYENLSKAVPKYGADQVF